MQVDFDDGVAPNASLLTLLCSSLDLTFLQLDEFCFIFSLLAQAAKALTFVVCDKSKQKHALSKRSEGKSPSVIFLISPLCFLAGVLPFLCFQESFLQCDRYFLLLPYFVLFALLPASIYSLLAPVDAMRCFFWL